MRICIKNSTIWRTRELRNIVTRVKSQWFDSDDRMYVIHFKMAKGYTGTHGLAWYTRNHCEVYMNKHQHACDEWLVRVVHHELLHLKQRAGGRSWEIQQRRMDRAWCNDAVLRARIAWCHDIKLVKKHKNKVAYPVTRCYINTCTERSVETNNKPKTKERENNMTETKTKIKTRKSADRVQVAPNVFKASETSYYINVNGEMKYCVKDRLDKLLAKAGGDYVKLVENYRTRARKTDPANVG